MIDAHERKVTGIDWSKPAPAPEKLSHLQPGWDEIPKEHQERPNRHVLADYAAGKLKVKEGISVPHAIAHLDQIRLSWQYAVEHKSAALSYLGSLWLEPKN